MGENIEVKDVQKTEYLDKNGLDMLWAKVKENTRNQVEAERNRAITQETRIIETKADKSELDSYVSDTALKALEQKVTANTANINNKQDAGNYLHYETLNDKGYYEIPSVCIPDINYNLHHTILDAESLQIVTGDLEANDTTGIVIASNGRDPYIALTDSAYKNILKITREGISNADNNANHVYATDGSIANLTQYAKKSEITAGGNVDDVQVNGVSVVENKIANIKPATKENLGVVKVGDGLNVTDGTISVDTTAIGTGKYMPYEKYTSALGYDFPYNHSFWFKKTEDNLMTSVVINPGRVIAHDDNNGSVYIGQNSGNFGVSVDYGYDVGSALNKDNLIIYHYINGDKYIGAKLNKEGVVLLDGDNNHVLTSHGSTIDITQYVLKSVYDEKIAALEARIAALEAKHTETA